MPTATPAEDVPHPEEPSDAALVKRVLSGDREAFASLYRRHEKPIFNFLSRITGRRALAEDLLQETFVRAWQAARTFDPSRGSLRTWLHAIALNAARRELSRKVHSAPHLSFDSGQLDPHDHSLDVRTVERHLDRTLQTNALALALAALPDFLREVVVLRCYQQLSFAEIAQVTGAPEGTLKSRFHRAVAALRTSLGADKGGR